MNFFKKNRIVFWFLIFLVVINVAALATILTMQYKTNKNSSSALVEKPGMILQKELALTDQQKSKVEKINADYKAAAEPVIEKIREKKAELLDELSKDQTDTNQVKRIADEVCEEQKQLQKANINQFLDLKQVCTPEQTQKLSRIYSEMYGCQGKGNCQGRGKGEGHRHRYGRQGK